MKTMESHFLWKEKRNDFCSLIHYLKNILAPFQISAAIAFGSLVRGENTASAHSDIDIVAYSALFVRENAQQCLELIESLGGDFRDKAPLFLEDFISPRIEFFLRIGDTVFDINIFPTELGGYEKRFTNAVHDSLDLVIGAMYQEASLLFGEIPFEQLLKKEFFPFYCDELRAARMEQLEMRIRSGINKIEYAIRCGHDNPLYQIYKTRTYLIKWMFINARKYPVDYNRYLRRQLTQSLNVPEHTIDCLLLKNNSLHDACSIFVDTALQIISNVED